MWISLFLSLLPYAMAPKIYYPTAIQKIINPPKYILYDAIWRASYPRPMTRMPSRRKEAQRGYTCKKKNHYIKVIPFRI